MSDLYQLALSLRRADETSINRLIHERGLNLAEFKDFFDLAHAILLPKSQTALLGSVGAIALDSALALKNGQKLNKDQQRLLISGFFAYLDENEQPRLFDWFAERISPKLRPVESSELESNLTNEEDIIRDCGISAFEAMQAITELIFDFDQGFVREVGKGQLGLPDTKRLANHLGKDKEYVRAMFELGKLASLIAVSESRIVPTDSADSWINQKSALRWQLLAEAWMQVLGQSASASLLSQIQSQPKARIDELLELALPLAREHWPLGLARLKDLAAHLGLSSNSAAAPWLAATLAGKVAKAATDVAEHLPTQQLRVIIQADLSIIAPGPLKPESEIALRRIARTESIGLASSYRLSALSLTVGMEEGLSETQIRKILASLSDSPLPQPVDYLIRETAERFARIKILEMAGSSKIFVEDELLGKQLRLDAKLRPLQIETREGGLESPLSAIPLYHALREAGYLAVRVDQSGKIIPPSSQHSSSFDAQSFRRQLGRLREQDLELEQQSPQSDLERKVQLALRSKSTLRVSVSSAGKQLDFVLEPIGVANGRLRARDRRADIERTLPLSAITSITIG